MIRLMKTWLSNAKEGITATVQTDPCLIDRISGSFDAAFASNKEVLEYKVTLDITMAYPRVGGVLQVNGMAFLSGLSDGHVLWTTRLLLRQLLCTMVQTRAIGR